jgi:molybdopterin-guanine dinucleotide biosynthesis protein A
VYDAIVLAGGRGRRLGGAAKPQLVVGGRTLLDSVVAAVADARRIVIVGPEQPVARLDGAPRVSWRREEPPGGGPVAAVAAGLVATVADRLVILAADLPRIAPAVPRLLAALPSDGAALLTDPTGRPNYLAAAWRRASLVDALERLGLTTGASMRALMTGVPTVELADEDEWGRDCDTPDDLERARALVEGGADA